MTSEAPPAVDRTKPGWWKEYYQRNKAKVNARNKAWLEKNREKMLPKLRAKWRRNAVKNRLKRNASRKARRLKNPEPYRARNREWQKRRWSYRQEYMRNYYLKNNSKLKKQSADYYAKNKKRCLETSTAWKKRNPLKVAGYQKTHRPKAIIYHRKWRALNRGRWAAQSQRRRALQRAAAINLKSIAEWMQSVRKKERATCYYCRSVVSAKTIHFDHIVALSKGGAHSVDNLCVSCASCNLRKSTKSVQAWVRIGQQLLSL